MKRRDVLIGLGGTATLATAGVAGWRMSTATMADYARYSARLRAPLPSGPGPAELIRYATLAVNSHNSQPWRFHMGRGMIGIAPDFARRIPVVDPDDHHLFVSLGCVAENLSIAASATGRPGELEAGGGGGVLRYHYVDASAHPDPLLAAIVRRRSSRTVYDGRPVSTADLETLRRAAEMPGVRLVLLTDRSAIASVRDLVVASNSAQMADPAFMRELKDWLRFNPRRAMATGDGLFTAASGNPVMPDLLAGPVFDHFFTAAAENDRYARQIDSTPGIAVFVGDRADREHWTAVGRACQRFALTATRLGLAHAFINQPVEVAGLRGQLAALAGEPELRPDIVMRFGHGPTMPYSPRRPVAAVLSGMA